MFLDFDNKFTARGRLTREPFANFSENGNLVTSITIAQKTPFKNSKGEYETAFITYVAMDTQKNKAATNLAEFATTGTEITLEGYNDSYSKVNEQGTMDWFEIKKITRFRIEETKEQTEQRRQKNKEKGQNNG